MRDALRLFRGPRARPRLFGFSALASAATGLPLGRLVLGAIQIHQFERDLFPLAALGAVVAHAIGQHLIFARDLVVAVFEIQTGRWRRRPRPRSQQGKAADADETPLLSIMRNPHDAHRLTHVYRRSLEAPRSKPPSWARTRSRFSRPARGSGKRRLRACRAIALLNRAREKYDLTPLVIHDNYLINLASSHETMSAKFDRGVSRRAGTRHRHRRRVPGRASRQLQRPDRRAGHYAFSRRRRRTAAAGLKFGKLMLLVGITVGAGAQIGGRFEELHVIREYAPRR